MAVVASAARASADSRAWESVADEGDGEDDDDGGVHAGGGVKRRMSEARGEARAATALAALADDDDERTTKRSGSERESDGDGPGDVRWTPTLVGDLRASRRLTREELTRELGDDRDGSKARGLATSSASTKEMLASRNDVWGASRVMGHVIEDSSEGVDTLGMTRPEDVIRAISMHGWRFNVKDFQFLKVIGRGRYSLVYKALNRRMNSEVAVKCYIKSKLKQHVFEQIAHEIALLGDMRHPNITKFYGSFVDEKNGNYYLIHELQERSDVFNALARSGGKFTETRAVQSVLKPVIHAVSHLHSMNIIHRDIKPENVLLTEEGRSKLTDFGFSVHLGWYKPLGRLGTTDYMSPEVVRCNKGSREENFKTNKAGYGKAIDYWAIGALAFELITGLPPFQATNRNDAYKLILQAHVRYPAFVSDEAADFIQKCLMLNPSQRMNPDEMLQHPWIRANGNCKKGNADKSAMTVMDLDANAFTSMADAAAALPRAQSVAPVSTQSLTSKLSSMRISRGALASIRDEFDWQYSKDSVDAENELDSPVVNRSATRFAVHDDDEFSVNKVSPQITATRSFSLSYQIRRIGASFTRRFRARD